MSLNNKPFISMRLEEERATDKRKVYPISLNRDEQQFLFQQKGLLKQQKDSTVIKQLAIIGANVIQSPQITTLLNIIHSNKRKNKRLGINEFE